MPSPGTYVHARHHSNNGSHNGTMSYRQSQSPGGLPSHTSHSQIQPSSPQKAMTTVVHTFMNSRWRSLFKHFTPLKLIFLILLATLLIHRMYSHYEGRKVYVHSPIHTIERTCPEPSYPLLIHELEQIEAQKAQQPSNDATTTTKTDTAETSINIEGEEDEISQSSNQPPKICLTTLTDEFHRNVFQRLLRFRNFDGLLQLTWNNKQAYAQKYGYYLYDESIHLDTSRPPSWSKIKAVKRLLVEEQCDWVWWLDADTIIMNSNKRIESFLPASTEPQDIMISQDHGGGTGNYNAGSWLIRNSPYSLEFLDEWWNMENYVKPLGISRSGDNDAFKAMLQKVPEFDQHFLVPPRCTFNAFAYFLTPQEYEKFEHEHTMTQQTWYRDEQLAFFHKGDLVAHVAGYNNKEQPIQLLLQLAE